MSAEIAGRAILGCTDSESTLEPAKLVEVLIATAEHYLVYMNAAAITESDGQV